MDTGTLVAILVVALIVVVLLLLLRASGVGRHRPKLRSLDPESRDRYVREWDLIEMKFVHSPEQAVREAESLVLSVLRERGHPLTERDLPEEVRRAHKLGYSSKDRPRACARRCCITARWWSAWSDRRTRSKRLRSERWRRRAFQVVARGSLAVDALTLTLSPPGRGKAARLRLYGAE